MELGLYGKYIVARADGSMDNPNAQYFVLRIDTDPYARPALVAYADACEKEYPKLARDLRQSLRFTEIVKEDQ